MKRCNPFKPLVDRYATFRLSPDDRELQQLVLTEPSIRKYVVKAENYMLLVKESDKAQLAKALRRFGYLLQQ